MEPAAEPVRAPDALDTILARLEKHQRGWDAPADWILNPSPSAAAKSSPN